MAKGIFRQSPIFLLLTKSLVWKALNVEDYPLEIKQQSNDPDRVGTRACQRGRPIDIGMTNLTKNSSVSDAVRIWNSAPLEITKATT